MDGAGCTTVGGGAGRSRSTVQAVIVRIRPRPARVRRAFIRLPPVATPTNSDEAGLSQLQRLRVRDRMCSRQGGGPPRKPPPSLGTSEVRQRHRLLHHPRIRLGIPPAGPRRTGQSQPRHNPVPPGRSDCPISAGTVDSRLPLLAWVKAACRRRAHFVRGPATHIPRPSSVPPASVECRATRTKVWPRSGPPAQSNLAAANAASDRLEAPLQTPHRGRDTPGSDIKAVLVGILDRDFKLMPEP